MSKATQVTVFVEKDCLACDRTLFEVKRVKRNHPGIELRIYDREQNREQFNEFQVYAVPAVVINNKLVCYGGWSGSELSTYLEKKSKNKIEKEVIVKRKSLGRGIAAGMVGTAAMTVVALLGPLMGMPEMNTGRMLAGFMGIPIALGWFAHFMIGMVLALIYVYLLASKLPGSTLVRGALYGLIPWFVLQIMVNPVMGAGFFASQTPTPFMMVMGSLMGHLVYGAVVGLVHGQAEKKPEIVFTL